MAIKLDSNRKTFRSDVRSRSGKRLPGLQSHYQGVDLVEANIDRCLLPIIGRNFAGGLQSHEYSQVQRVYTSVGKVSENSAKRICDISLVLDPSSCSFNDGDDSLHTSTTTDFSGLVGQTFTILNPYYYVDNTHPQSWTFEFTMTEGIDPRKMTYRHGLYPGSLTATGGQKWFEEIGKHPMNVHNPRPMFPYADQWSTADYQQKYRDVPANQAKLALYGAYNSTTGRYEIPMGLSPINRYQDIPEVQDIKANTGYWPRYRLYDDSGIQIHYAFTSNAEASWGIGSKNGYQVLFGSNPVWLYLCITRAIANVLPAYFTILEAGQIPLPVGVERGSSPLHWNAKNPNKTPYTGNQRHDRNPLIVKLHYTGKFADTWVGGPNLTTGSDIGVSTWLSSDPAEYTYSGARLIEKEKHTFYEDFRTDYLQITNFDNFQRRTIPNDGTGAPYYAPMNTTGDIAMYSPQVSVGSNFFSAGDVILGFENILSSSVPSSIGIEVTSELVTINKVQKRDEIPNTALDNFTFFEDVHYIDTVATGFDGWEQTWSYMQQHYKEFVNPADHGGDDQAAFVQHMTNLLDKNYVRETLIDEYPMSGRIDVLTRNNSFHTNTPPSVLERTMGCSSIQYLDPDCVVQSLYQYKKKSEDVGMKKFEDIRGIRRPPESEYWRIEYDFVDSTYGHLMGTASVYTRVWSAHGGNPLFGDHNNPYWTYIWAHPRPGGVVVSMTGDRIQNNNLVANITYVPERSNVLDSSDRIQGTGGDPDSIRHDNSIMFNDYFDQQEPEILDYVEDENWTRIDSEMLNFLSAQRWDHDNDGSTEMVETYRPERKKWQEDEYLYANTGHTTVHYEKVNGIISQEHKR